MMNEKQLKELFDSLSFEEKLGQVTQLNNLYFGIDGMITGETNNYLPTRTFTNKEIDQLGTLFSIFGVDKIRNLQEKHMQNNKTPMIFMGDVTGGYYVGIGSGFVAASTFDTDLVEKVYHQVAVEATRDGMNVTFHPQSDVSRDARWGRCGDAYGEDTYLSSEMTRAAVRGYQGEGIGAMDSMVACIKHFAAYGAPISGKDYDDADVSDRTLLEKYLPPFKAGVEEGAGMIMASFNTVSGVPVVFNKKLVRDTLRKDWGFDGVVISDYSAISGCITQGSANCQKDIAKYAMEATVDIDMMDNIYQRNIPALLESGELSEEVFNESVMRILRLKNKLGLLDDPYKYMKAPQFTVKEFEESFALTEKLSDEGCILLKNDGILPLCGEDVAVVGPFGDADLGGGLTAHTASFTEELAAKRKELCRSLWEELGDVPHERACPKLEYDNFLSARFRETEPCYGNEEEYLARAVELAKNSKTVVVTIGEAPGQAGESRSRADIALPEVQMNMLRKIHEVNENIVVVLYTGRPVLLEEVSKLSKAILCVWHPGNTGNRSIAKLLLGKAVPSGRVPMSFPRTVGQMPLNYDYLPNGHIIRSPECDYSLRYVDVSHTPLYPFGFGLSYTEFEYSDVTVDNNILTMDGKVTASVNITNKGDYDADEVVQMYIRDNTASMIARPVRELKGFKRVHIRKGETVTVSFEIDETMLRFWNAEDRYESEVGGFTVFIGPDSTTNNAVGFRLEK